ncbi:hypothetical protein LPJ78_000550 [Coemansia sp. RSA 989]|nr:hypothetical protein LPJ78_000550 [Coemansia sp. RSA 989]KAJ1875405.1 hypothetical protein LPJ55_000761 [Coemansia sp. RSA 990]
MAISSNSAPSADAASTFMLMYGRFEAAHQQQLESLGLPKPLWKVLFKKLLEEKLDIGEWVIFGEKCDGMQNLSQHQLCLQKDELAAESDVFLVDHIWTTTASSVQQDLERIPGLLERMEQLTGIYPPLGSGELDDPLQDINVPVVMSQANVSEDQARELLRKHGGDIVEAIAAASESDQSKSDTLSVQNQIMQQLQTEDDKPLQWKTCAYEVEQYSLDGSDQLDGIDIRVPVGLSAGDVTCQVTSKHLKAAVGGKTVVDGDLHAPVEADEATWTVEKGVLTISLVKHTAEYWPKALLNEQRLDPALHKKHVQRVARDLWRYLQGYGYMARNSRQELSRSTSWYVPDGVGLALCHSETPNMRCLPFLFINDSGQLLPFNIMWPIKTISRGQVLTRDYCPAWLTDPPQRQGYLHSIFPDTTQFALDAHAQLLSSWAEVAQNAVRATLSSPSASSVGRLFVRSIDPQVQTAAADAGFELAARPEDADIVFDDEPRTNMCTNHHGINAAFFSTENAAMVLQRIAGAQPWLSPAFLLKRQIREFIGAALMHNHSWWLLKGDQVAQGIDMPTVLTDNWVTAVRHVDVGYVVAQQCAPSMVINDQLCLLERLVLLTPDNCVYLWNGPLSVFQYAVSTSKDKHSEQPCQILQPASVVSTDMLAQQLGSNVFARFVDGSEKVVADVMRLLLGLDTSDGKAFGVFRLLFAVGENNSPVLYEAHPMQVAEQQAVANFIPAIAAAVAGKADKSFISIK